MKKLIILSALAASCAGCMCAKISPEHERRIAQYRHDGSLAKAKDEIGYTVNPTPTFFWALIPGANQIHIYRKIKQSPYYDDFARDYPHLMEYLINDGIGCVIFSWFPLIYEFSMPCQMGSGVYPDVARINNLAWMYHLDAEAKKAKVK